jgi:hypothetical protein
MPPLTDHKSNPMLLKPKTILLGYKAELLKTEEKPENYTKRDVTQTLYSLKPSKTTKMLYKSLPY